MREVTSRVAVVTGAGTGIGKAVALGLAHSGFSVIAAGRRRELLDATAAEARVSGDTVIAAQTDVTDPTAVGALFDRVGDLFGRLDVLFNNAGRVAHSVPLEDLTFDDWKSVVDVNLTGTFLCAQAAFRMMKNQNPQGGRIINNGSISAYAPRPLSVAYTATKHAITGLTKSISLDGRAYDIACGQIDLGNAATDMTVGFVKGARQPNGEFLPEPRIDLEHVVRAVVYMANLPLGANVQTMLLMATKMPFVGRG